MYCAISINPGKCLALVGPSGSGKSTLGRLVLGLEKPDTGTIVLNGKPLEALRGEEKLRARRSVQAVFQNSLGAVNPRFTAFDIIAEPLVNFDRLGRNRLFTRVGELLEEVGIEPDEMKKYPHQFSGGELQRICIARALAPRPDLIVLDEAVSSLDMINQSRILSLIGEIKKTRNTSFLFITHDMRVVANCADSMAVIENGVLGLYLEKVNETTISAATYSLLYRNLMDAVLPGGATHN